MFFFGARLPSLHNGQGFLEWDSISKIRLPLIEAAFQIEATVGE